MTGKRLLLIFITAGLILAAVIGVYVYQISLEPSAKDVSEVLTGFTEKIAAGDLSGAREFLTPDTRSLLRDPGTALGEAIYRGLKLQSVDELYAEGENRYSAGVILTTPDTLTIMAKAGILFDERILSEGNSADPDQLIAEIYEEILSRDDIPVTDHFCVVHMEWQNGKLLIRADEAFQQVLEGAGTANSTALKQIFSQ